MKIDPELPGLVELWKQWFAGERTTMIYLAVLGTTVLSVLLIISTVAILL